MKRKAYHIDGVMLKNRRQKSKIDYGNLVKGFVSIVNPSAIDKCPDCKPIKQYKPRPNARIPHKMEEKKIEKDIIKYLRSKGFKCGKINPEIGSWNAGIADILCFTSTEQWYIEVKTKKGRQQNNQKEFQAICERCGLNYMIARSVDDVKFLR